MLKLRKGDIWKAVVLVVLIAATGWFISRTLRQMRGPAPAARAAQGPAEQAQRPAQAPAVKEMFAPRTRDLAALAKAASAPDPFRPYVSTETVAVSTAPSAAKAAPPPPPPAPELAGLRLTGVVLGSRPMAVLRSGEERYFLRSGEALPSGWRIARIETRGIALTRGGERVFLEVSKEETSAPASARR